MTQKDYREPLENGLEKIKVGGQGENLNRLLPVNTNLGRDVMHSGQVMRAPPIIAHRTCKPQTGSRLLAYKRKRVRSLARVRSC